jgi:hypothetical protein
VVAFRLPISSFAVMGVFFSRILSEKALVPGAIARKLAVIAQNGFAEPNAI